MQFPTEAVLLLVAILAALGTFVFGLVALDTEFIVGNFFVNINLFRSAFMALGTAKLHVGLVGESYLAKGTTFVLVVVSSKCSTRESDQGKQSDNSLFHRYNLLSGV